MIFRSRATLSIYGVETTAAQIAVALSMACHEEHERGDPTRAALAGREVAPGRDTYATSH